MHHQAGANCTDAKLYFWTIFQFFFYPNGTWTHPPTSKLFLDFWNFFNFAKPLRPRHSKCCIMIIIIIRLYYNTVFHVRARVGARVRALVCVRARVHVHMHALLLYYIIIYVGAVCGYVCAYIYVRTCMRMYMRMYMCAGG